MTLKQPVLRAEIARQICILKIVATNVFLRQTAAHYIRYALVILRGIVRIDCPVESTSVHDLNYFISTVFNLVI